jgi:hypothetical protein
VPWGFVASYALAVDTMNPSWVRVWVADETLPYLTSGTEIERGIGVVVSVVGGTIGWVVVGSAVSGGLVVSGEAESEEGALLELE